MNAFLHLLDILRLPEPAELRRRFTESVRANWQWWGVSAATHMFIFCIAALLLGGMALQRMAKPVMFEADNVIQQDDLEPFNVGHTPLEPTELSTETLAMLEPPAQTEKKYDDSEIFQEAGGGRVPSATEQLFGGLGGFDAKALGEGAVVHGPGGVGVGVGTGLDAGSGGAASGYGGRGSGSREAMLGAFGGTRQSERAVAAGLNWLARHQNPNGSWSIEEFRCPGGTNACGGAGSVTANAGATALGLLPFLAAGQTHKAKGPYQKTITNGLGWLVKSQDRSGELSAGSTHVMYSHGLATIALCEAYGMTQDPFVGRPAQLAVNFIQEAQNKRTGGWRYTPGAEGDTSVVGWMVMALKSAQMAGLQVDYFALQNADKFLQSVSRGSQGGLFGYQPGTQDTRSMTAVGLLCKQYLGAAKDAPLMVEGTRHLMDNLPQVDDRDIYYWYYATQVMHNVPGGDWDKWNRTMRRNLIESQIKTGCAAGSWDPEKPFSDSWGHAGGRLMLTSLATLTLEVYYRYLPLYNLDGKPKTGPAASRAEPNLN